ncbi:aspartate/glutamate racemase family protein [uncultured Devosia sp.]|uniref:aspartate/glutamate racemase family protein n=1 Tax=uncultured Devosia sp. TaxID=211434 RepID=UPI0035CB0736
MKIACLHTLASNIAVFEAACPPGVKLSHVVRDDLLLEAERAGGVTHEIEARAAAELHRLGRNADAVLLTCSTIGSAVDLAASDAPVPVLRADASLAQASVAQGGEVVVLCAVETTVEPSRKLFLAAAERAHNGATIEVRVVPGAWAAFRRGDISQYHKIVAGFADELYRDGHQTIALAQASMAGAAALCQAGKPLTSPDIGLVAAARQASAAMVRS